MRTHDGATPMDPERTNDRPPRDDGRTTAVKHVLGLTTLIVVIATLVASGAAFEGTVTGLALGGRVITGSADAA